MSVAELSLRDARPLTRAYREHSISSVDVDPGFEETKVRLMMLVHHFYQTSDVNIETTVSAMRVLNALPPDRAIPKVAPDGDGGLIFVWQLGNAHTLLTVVGQELWPVSQAATANAHHWKQFSSTDGVLRQKLIAFVPGR